jgi:predicted enzyme related to lactoylglutathione lyase
MGERTSHAPGAFSSVDLATSDPGAAKAFYGELFGWQSEDMMGTGGMYTIFRLDGKHVAGCFGTADRAEAGFTPHWNSYITVEAADASVSRAAELGGSLLMQGQDVEEMTFHEVPAPQRRYRIRNGESENGSLYLQPEEERSAPPNWLAYFATADLDATNSTLTRLGGRMIVEPLAIAAGRVAVATDPQGAALGLFEGELDR